MPISTATVTSDTKHNLSIKDTPKRLQYIPILFDELGLTELSDEQLNTIAQIDSCLPQTQCGLCDHPEGCLPYAYSIVVKGEIHNKCVPGGQPISNKIASIINKPFIEVVESKWKTNQKTNRPTEVRAFIREEDCIGCTKCIPACPVDAIIGTGKHMHTILTDLCTGCELCLAPCPVDCIDLVTIDRTPTDIERTLEQQHLRQRYHHHLNRVAEQINDKRNSKPVISMVQSKLNNATNNHIEINEDEAKNTIASAKIRTKIKKLEKQLIVRDNEKKRAELESLKAQLNDLVS